MFLFLRNGYWIRLHKGRYYVFCCNKSKFNQSCPFIENCISATLNWISAYIFCIVQIIRNFLHLLNILCISVASFKQLRPYQRYQYFLVVYWIIIEIELLEYSNICKIRIKQQQQQDERTNHREENIQLLNYDWHLTNSQIADYYVQ